MSLMGIRTPKHSYKRKVRTHFGVGSYYSLMAERAGFEPAVPG